MREGGDSVDPYRSRSPLRKKKTSSPEGGAREGPLTVVPAKGEGYGGSRGDLKCP